MSRAIESLRMDFPVLHQTMKDHPLVYLDNAATTQKPQSVIDAMSRYYAHDNANVHRGVYQLAERATKKYEDSRKKVQAFIHAKHSEECVFVRGTTEAINLVAHSYVMPMLKPGDEIIISALEHHSNIVPWHLVAKKTGAVIRVIPIHKDCSLDLEAFQQLFTPKTKFLSLGYISNAVGTRNPIKWMIEVAHQHGVKVLIDGAQSVGHLRIDVQDLNCDFFAFSGHKMYGPTGIGVLYGRQALLDAMEPYQGGGEMITEVFYDHSEYQKAPHRFEAGTPNIADAIGLGAAIDYLSVLDRPALEAYEHELFTVATDAIQSISGYHIIGTAKEKGSIISFVHDDIHPHDLATVLDNFGIAVRAGHHCAMPLMNHLGIAATARASFAFYNTRSDIDRLIEGLEQAREVFA